MISTLELLQARKAELAEVRERARKLAHGGATGIQVAASISDGFDRLLAGIFAETLATLPAETRTRVEANAALIAVGGSGRGEMAPFSDADVLLLYRPSIRDAFQHLSGILVRDCWDAGIKLGHSVRTISETASLARKEIQVSTALIGARLLCGDESLFDDFERKCIRGMLRGRQRAFLEECLEARMQERLQHGGTVSSLEPDVKRSPGGLRDIHFIRWVGYACYGVSDLDSLRLHGALSKEDARALVSALEFLQRVRMDLHFAAGRLQDVLTREEQLRMTEARRIPGVAGQLPVERFMQEYFRHTSSVASIAQRFVSLHRRPSLQSRALQFLTTRRVNGIFKVGEATLDVFPGSREFVCSRLDRILRLFYSAALYRVSPSPALCEHVKQAIPRLAEEGVLISQAEARTFLQILSCRGNLGELLRTMYNVGLLELLIPAMSHARCLLQFNQYHSFTVDEHTLRAVEAAEQFGDDPGPVGTAYRKIVQKDILHLALLLHDLGKGFEEDHSDVGKRTAEVVADRLFLSDHKRGLLVYLVHKHLSMSHLAFRRDISDPETLLRFAHDVGSPDTLRMLYVLTAADIQAVGPGVWTDWKADLLAELFDRCMLILSGKPYRFQEEERLRAVKAHVRESIVPLESSAGALALQLGDGSSVSGEEWIDRHIDAFPPHYLMANSPDRIARDLGVIQQLRPGELVIESQWDEESTTVEYRIIASPELSEGFFHKAAGLLTAKRLNILSAQICTTLDGVVVDSFRVIDNDYAGVVPPDRRDEVSEALRGALTRKTAFEQLFQRNMRFSDSRESEPVSALPMRVVIDNDSSDFCSIIDVFAHDRPGLLFTVSKAIYKLELSVVLAKIATHFDQVVDVFYVTEPDGRKIVDGERLRDIRNALTEAITEFEREGYQLFVA